MSEAHRKPEPAELPLRVIGRGIHAKRGVHLPLRTLRDASGKTQVEVAELADMDQADISRLENRDDFDDCHVDTLRRYVEALGGKLELTMNVGNRRIIIVGVDPDSA